VTDKWSDDKYRSGILFLLFNFEFAYLQKFFGSV